MPTGLAEGTRPHWLLFDVARDYGEIVDVHEEQPDVVEQLASEFDGWWASLSGSFVNETVIGPPINPFKERFWRQFGGGPSAEDLRLMDMNQSPATRPVGAKPH